MTKAGTKQENLIGRKKVNRYTLAQCDAVLLRLSEDPKYQDDSVYARHVKARRAELIAGK